MIMRPPYHLRTDAQGDWVKGGLAQIDDDRLNLCLTLHGDDPPSGFLPTAIITQLGSPGGGPSHYRHYTNYASRTAGAGSMNVMAITPADQI